MDRKELRNRMFYTAPDAKAARRHKALQEAALEFGEAILKNTQPGREQSLALTKLEEAKMWGNASIAHEPSREKQPVGPGNAALAEKIEKLEGQINHLSDELKCSDSSLDEALGKLLSHGKELRELREMVKGAPEDVEEKPEGQGAEEVSSDEEKPEGQGAPSSPES